VLREGRRGNLSAGGGGWGEGGGLCFFSGEESASGEEGEGVMMHLSQG